MSRMDANGWEWFDPPNQPTGEEVRGWMSNTTVSGMTQEERDYVRKLESRLASLESERATEKNEREKRELEAKIRQEYEQAQATTKVEEEKTKTEAVPVVPEPEKPKQARRWF